MMKNNLILAQRYLRNSSFMEYKVKPTDSRIWKAMHKFKPLILDELSWVVGKGEEWIQVFKDKWGPRDFTI